MAGEKNRGAPKRQKKKPKAAPPAKAVPKPLAHTVVPATKG